MNAEPSDDPDALPLSRYERQDKCLDMSPKPRHAFSFKRSTDLLPPPVDLTTIKSFKLSKGEFPAHAAEWESESYTGCIIASSHQRRTRAGLVLYQGRAVGCIYGSVTMPDPLATEESLKLMLKDAALGTAIRMYSLPEELIVPLSALFIGYPHFRTDDQDVRSYYREITQWFSNRGQTACIIISLPKSLTNCLCFIYQGAFIGAFFVEDQELHTDAEFVYELLKNDPAAAAEASILPPEMISSTVPIGFSIAGARQLT